MNNQLRDKLQCVLRDIILDNNITKVTKEPVLDVLLEMIEDEAENGVNVGRGYRISLECYTKIVEELKKDNRKIQAIKAFRRETNAPLVDAKEIVEDMQEELKLEKEQEE